MTEKEATKLVCPQLFQTATITSAIIRCSGAEQKAVDALMEGACCIASGCMMFRSYLRPIQSPTGQTIGEEDAVYCGLAGKP